MLKEIKLPRVFIHTINGEEVRLSDPSITLSPYGVRNFYKGIYPILTSAEIVGPEILKDERIYKFELSMGTKG